MVTIPLCIKAGPLLQVFPFPGRDATYQVPFTRVVYIEQDDFREQDHKKYFGLAPGKSVLLRYLILRQRLGRLTMCTLY